MTATFHASSLELTNLIPKTIKKEQGIFFTPPKIIKKLFGNLIIQPHHIVLEPCFGSGEFLHYLSVAFPGIVVDAVEKNQLCFDTVMRHEFPGLELHPIVADFTTFVPTRFYDFIVGNPPYVVCKKETVPLAYQEFTVGRPNLFGIFILHSLSMLKIGGILAFVIPKSFLNSSYYNKIRQYVVKTCEIVSLIDFESDGGFLETQQSTVGLILRKVEGLPETTNYHTVVNGNTVIMTDNLIHLNQLFCGSTTLFKLGFRVKTGPIVWNQHKELLTADDTQTVLIYNTNIKNDTHQLVWKTSWENNESKHQYIRHPGSTDSVIVVNRGNGNSSYTLSFAFVDLRDRPYLVENHLNIITAVDGYSNDSERRQMYQLVLASLVHPKTEEFIRLVLGNGGCSKTELETILPIYV